MMTTAADLNRKLDGNTSSQDLIDALQSKTWGVEVLATGKQYNAMVALVGRLPRTGATVSPDNDKAARQVAKAVTYGYIALLDDDDDYGIDGL